MRFNELLALFLISATACAVLLYIVLHSPLARRVMDQPGRLNSMHTEAIPRVGGAVLMLVVLLLVTLKAFFGDFSTSLIAILAAAFALTCISMMDDVVSLSPRVRLIAHMLAASFISLYLWVDFTRPTPWMLWAAVVACILIITWATNLFNFMDGADGLAGGMALFGFGAYAIAAAQAASASTDSASIASLSAIIAGAASGFLAVNFPPAKVFMGDAGSISLGFLAATLGLYGISVGMWPWWFPLLVFSPFVVDATVTLLKRIARREKIWVAHRQHYYHRLILSGWNHRRTALSYYLLMAGCGASALIATKVPAVTPMLALWVVIYVILLSILEWHLKPKVKPKVKPKAT